MSSFTDWFNNLGEKIENLPATIINGIKDFIVPDADFISEKVAYLQETFAGLGVSSYDMSPIFEKEAPLDDLKVDMYGQELTIVRFDIANEAIGFFRKIIRGFITLLLVMYNYDMFMGLIGQPGMQLGNLLKHNKGGKDD